jgi:hypothetical protein
MWTWREPNVVEVDKVLAPHDIFFGPSSDRIPTWLFFVQYLLVLLQHYFLIKLNSLDDQIYTGQTTYVICK